MGGKVGIGTTNPTVRLHVVGKARIINMDYGSANDVQIKSDGNFVQVTSSRRYKEDIKDLKVNLLDILKLRPVSFKWKESGEYDIGMIAEEVDKCIPDLIVYDEEGRPDGLKYDRISLYLLEIIKAQHDELKKQQNQIEDQNEEINNQQKQIEDLNEEINNQHKMIQELQNEINEIKELLNINE
jgi:hypothetical protein